MKFLYLIMSNFKRKKVRTALTLLSVLMAFLLFGYLAAIKAALSMGVELTGADRLVVRHKVSIIQLLPEKYTARLEQIPGVTEVAHSTWFGGIYQDPRNYFPQFSVEPERYLSMFPEFLLPEEE
ncbi:MAG: ABC transporter permease, partial [Acidobacteriota bacterium]